MDRKRKRLLSSNAEEKRTKFDESESGEPLEVRLRSNHAEVVLTALNYCKQVKYSLTVNFLVLERSPKFLRFLYFILLV